MSVIFLLHISLEGNSISLTSIRNQYLNMSQLTMYAHKKVKDENKLNIELFNCYLQMQRLSNKSFDLVYYDPASTCILLNKSTQNKIKYFNRFVDSFEYFDINKQEIIDCYQLTGVNISGFENPFSDCFYHTEKKANNAILTDASTHYYYEMKSSYVGFAKQIWINKNTLLVDSIYYTAGTLKKKIYYQYSNIVRIKKNSSIQTFNRSFDSLVTILKSLPVTRNFEDTLKINNTLKQYNKLTLLDFWFIGCKPCLAGFPKLQSIRDSFQNSLLNIIAINPVDRIDNIEHFQSKYRYTFQLEKDSIGYATFYKINSFPTLILIDSSGNIIKRIEGGKKEEIEALIAEIKTRINYLKQ